MRVSSPASSSRSSIRRLVVADPLRCWNAACEPKHQVERWSGSGPVLSDKIRTRTSKEGAENDGDDDHVVERTHDRDEVGNEI